MHGQHPRNRQHAEDCDLDAQSLVGDLLEMITHLAAWSLAWSPGAGLPQRAVRPPAMTARSHSVMCGAPTNIFPGDELDEIGVKWLPPKPAWVEAVLDNGDCYWWRDVPGSNEPEVRFTDPNVTPGTVSTAGSSTSPVWNQGVLESGAPYWWRDSDAEDDGIEVSLSDPDAADASE